MIKWIMLEYDQMVENFFYFPRIMDPTLLDWRAQLAQLIVALFHNNAIQIRGADDSRDLTIDESLVLE
jgi:hypothetical protein